MPVTISPGVLAVVKDQSPTPTGMRVPLPDTVHCFRVAYDRCFRISRYVPMLQIRACFRGKAREPGSLLASNPQPNGPEALSGAGSKRTLTVRRFSC
jgi:hypothetical protein